MEIRAAKNMGEIVDALEASHSGVYWAAKGAMMPIRWNSPATFLDQPLMCIAIGPDPAKNEVRGHARGILAIGDFATGVFAFGGIARGVVAIGGLAMGGVALGGLSLGLLAFGGLALGWLALGGLAVGYAAEGGLALGYYALGGAAFGKYVVNSMRHDPQAMEFFSKLCHGIFMPRGLRPPLN